MASTTTKTLIEKSIEIYGMGHPEVKTIFNIEKEEDRQLPLFRSLTTICGRTLTAWFKYTENEIEVESKCPMVIPTYETEEEVKVFILNALSNYINK